MNSTGTPAPVLTVSQLNGRARLLLERSFTTVQVCGEVSGLRVDAAGHRWFCLKDPGAVLNAVIFRREAAALRFPLKDGVQLVATGRLTIYAPNGRYQLVASRLELQGAGARQAALEELKARLQAEGLFDSARKRPLPQVPRRVAVVTSPTGAVIRDIVQVSRRRFPNARMVLIPTRVQGADCGAQVARALERVGRLVPKLGFDVVIVARGGGSAEDLWGFNEERVVRAIAACPVPVVSAVGHETDITLADFAADRRAPTPSAAAELVFPQKSELVYRLQRVFGRVAQAVRRDLAQHRLQLRALRAELGDGRAPVELLAQRLAHLQTQLHAGSHRQLTRRRLQLDVATTRLQGLHPRLRLATLRQRIAHAQGRLVPQGQRHIQLQRRHLQALTGRLVPQGQRHVLVPRRQLEVLAARMHTAVPRHVAQGRARLGAIGQRLQALSPLGILGRGYGIVLSAQGQAVRGPQDVQPGERLDIRVADGQIWARVE